MIEEKKILKEKMHFHYMNYLTTPWHMNPCRRHYMAEILPKGRKTTYYIQSINESMNPCPGGNEIFNFGGPFYVNVHH